MNRGAAAQIIADEESTDDGEALAERAAELGQSTYDKLPLTAKRVWDEAISDPRRRRQLARQSIPFFAFYYLRARGKRVSVPACHVKWYEQIGTGAGYRKSKRQRKMLLLAPRSHGKSHVSCWVVPLHRICFQRNVRILILGAAMEAATKWLRRIRVQLETNPRIIEDFGVVDLGDGRVSTGFRDKAAPWTDHKIQVQRSDQSLADATVVASGARGGVLGGRFDLIIADDPESDASVLTDTVRKQTRTWFRATIQELLEPWGESLVIGTRKHNDDLYAHLMRDRTVQIVETKAIFRFRCFECKADLTNRAKQVCDDHPDARVEMVGVIPQHEWVLDKWGKIVSVRVLEPANDRPKVLWPEVWPLEALLFKRESMTSVLFSRENQNDVVSDENSPFMAEWLNAAKTRGLKMPVWKNSAEVPGDWVVIQSVDPAFVDDEKKAQDADSDYFVHMVVAVNLRNWHRRILRCWRGRGRQPSLYTAKIRATAAPFQEPAEPYHLTGALKWIVVENNSFGKFYELGLRRDTDLPMVPHSTTIKKADPFTGVDAMGALFENNMISWARKPPKEGASVAEVRAYEEQEQFIDTMFNELYGLGSEAHDDTVMALYLCEIAIRRLRRSIEKAAKGSRLDPTRRVTAPNEAPLPETDPDADPEERARVSAALSARPLEDGPAADDLPIPEDDTARPNPPRPNEPRQSRERPNGEPVTVSAPERVLAAVRAGAGATVACTVADWPAVKVALVDLMAQCVTAGDLSTAQGAMAAVVRLGQQLDAGVREPTADEKKEVADAPLGRPINFRPGNNGW